MYKNRHAIVFVTGIVLLFGMFFSGIGVHMYLGATAQKTIQSKYGEDIVIEDSKQLGSTIFSNQRYLITKSSKDKVVDKGYFIVLSGNRKEIKTIQELDQSTIVTLLVNSENE